jgi:hypothetical protein
MLQKRSLYGKAKARRGAFVDGTGIPRSVMACGVEETVWIARMFSEGSRPSLCDGMGAAEQARICADSREPARVRKIDQCQRSQKFEVGEMPAFQSSLCDGSDSSGLAEGFDERAIFIEPYIQDSEREVRRIEAIAACLAEEHRTLTLHVQAKEHGPDRQLMEKGFPFRQVQRWLRVFSGKIGHAAPCSPYTRAARITDLSLP